MCAILAWLAVWAFLGPSGWCAERLLPTGAAEALPPRVSVSELDNTARSHLERAEAFLANGQHGEAIDTVRRVMDTAGEKLIAVAQRGRDASYGFVRYVTVRSYCHCWLSRLHRIAPEALRLYRSQVDVLAERWLEQALADRDASRLERVVDEFFASSFGDQALWYLGELLLERGEFRKARECWERLSPVFRFPPTDNPALLGAEGRSLWWSLRSTDLAAQWSKLEPLLRATATYGPSWLAYPDTDVNLDDARARLVLVSILEGDLPRARWELDLLHRLAPEAKGQIGGRQGRYVDLLQSWLVQSADWPTVSREQGWTTFAGTATRNRTAPADVDVAGKPIWQVELPRRKAPEDSAGSHRLRVAESSDGLLCYHPVVVDDLVVVCTGTRESDFEGIRLQTGETVFPRGDPATRHDAPEERVRSAAGVPRFTMTAENGRLYARAGSPITGVRPEDGNPIDSPGQILAMNLAAERKLVLEIRLEGPEWGEGWAFEGTPLVDGSRLYVALRRRDAVRAESHVACFDAQQGRLQWRQFIGAAESQAEQRTSELTHNLLTLDQDSLFFNSNLGVVAALRASDGDIQWLTTYPRLSPNRRDPDQDDRYLFRDLNPCVLYRDMVFVAPADCDRVFALDAITGHPLWVTPPDQVADAVHVLGIGADHLLVSGDCLYWLDVYRGQLVGQFPQPCRALPGHARPSPRGLGRGVLAGSHVYWPTQETIFVLEQQTLRTQRGWEPVLVREIPLRPRGVCGGNLVIANGILLLATADRLYAFNETGK